ncbi:endolytic transglycosylase MltG [Roseivirga sp. UBA1976]|uniref:endolytic transglycosylase MltG n=1 Tax=Roseivirga sp. UBA1976 TaxID=1947386 RepID=UPI00257BB271|nr:endolytic transglycosylase MltG [Roseivirga sp. UBA1976]|tara:strand:- start:1367 stop:2401 length:1035 start_codon:yes stop_codon:yes gene_type:complete
MQKRKRFVLFMVIFSLLLTTFSFYFYQLFYGANILTESEAQTILIDHDDTFDSLRNNLYEARVIEDAVSFSFVAKILRYQKAVKPGVYLLDSKMSNLDAIRKLRAGNQTPVDITFNNVRFKSELSEKITSNVGASTEEFEALLNDDEYLAEFGFNSQNVMAMFIPNTYEVYWSISAKGLFERMHKEYMNFWTEERKNKAVAIGLSPVEVATLASIVQDESIMGDEKPKIAGLYINRLNKKMLLQADPTVKFALGDFTIKRVLTADTQVDSPYNTYRYRGLPPGPINLPSISSLNAVLNYEEHSYIYMCAKEDFSGYHRFAKTLAEHNRNARLFQQALNKRNIYR